MKKIFLILLLLAVSGASAVAQLDDRAVEHILMRKALSTDDISFNAVQLIPWFYREHKMDTVIAIASYWAKKCDVTEPLASFLILTKIKNHTFREVADSLGSPGNYRLENYELAVDSQSAFSSYNFDFDIMYCLIDYDRGCNIRTNPKRYSPGNTASNLVAAYGDYYDFLKEIAASLVNEPGLMPLEKFLVDYYADPREDKLARLRSKDLDGTQLQEVYKKYDAVSGIQLAMTSGLWLPMGNLSVLGGQYIFGFTFGNRHNKLMYDFNLSFRGGGNNTLHQFVNANDTLRDATFYAGYYVAADFGYQLMKWNRKEVDLLGGVAYDAFDIGYGNFSDKSYGTLNLNAGLGYKLFLRRVQGKRFERMAYIAFQGKFNFLNYDNAGGAGISGNAFTFSVVYGDYFRRYWPRNSGR